MNIFDWCIVAVLIFILAFVGVVSFVKANKMSKCLEMGYPSVRLDWKLNAYCVKRINQTDVVLPLK